MRIWLNVGALALSLVPALPVWAEYRWTDAEQKAMPEYCQARYQKESPQYIQWMKIIGPHFIHTHHYCDGLGWLARYYRAKGDQEKKRILQSAYGSFMYMVPRVDETWAMRGELYLNLGTVLALQKNDGEALKSMLKAIELEPRMARAYLSTADMYVKLKKNQHAVDMLAEGLRYLPGNAALQQKYLKLGGKEPFPEPYAGKEEKAGPETPVASTPVPGQEAPVVPAEPATQGAVPAVPEPVAGESAGKPAAGPEAPKGAPGNPWCRFCPR